MQQDHLDELYQRFDAERGRLAERLDGRWVVYTEGGVLSDHESEREALSSAFSTLPAGSFLVDQVTAVEPVVLLGFNAMA